MDQPLVSVGIPTYNRPEGLRRTLSLITGQTHTNLEIIISDNASPDSAVKVTVEEYQAIDPRIQFYQQTTNLGAARNFSFVLQKASGQYFMWAADDDEWDSEFVERCVAAIGDSSTVMTDFLRINRCKNLETSGHLADLSPEYSLYTNLKNHFQRMSPHIIYGLHRRKDILWMVGDEMFDWWDCYFISRMIVNGSGTVLLKDYLGYKAGTDTEEHIYKPIDPESGMRYLPFIRAHFGLVVSCPDLSIKEKILLLDKVLLVSLNLCSRHNVQHTPAIVSILQKIVVVRMKIQASLSGLLNPLRRKSLLQ